MKLTNWIRDAFIRSVDNDVPKVELSKEEVQELFVKNFPPEIKAIYDDEQLRKHLKVATVCTPTCHYDIVIGNLVESNVLKDYKSKTTARKEAMRKVRHVAYSCNTLKQLREVLPELTKHMPSENAPAKANVPMIIGVMEDLKKVGYSGAKK